MDFSIIEKIDGCDVYFNNGYIAYFDHENICYELQDNSGEYVKEGNFRKDFYLEGIFEWFEIEKRKKSLSVKLGKDTIEFVKKHL